MHVTVLGLLLVMTIACGRSTAVAADGGQVPPPVSNVEQLETRRVWAGNDASFYVAAPSPDGRLISEVDWSTGDLAVVDLEGGKRRVTNKGPWEVSDDYAEYSVFSPDGTRLAYTWFSGEAKGYEVRSSRLDGSDTQILFPARPDVPYLEVHDWSPDGSTVLVTIAQGDRTTQLGLIDVERRAYRPLKTHGWRGSATAAFSPDGRYVAHDLPQANDENLFDIRILAVDGTLDAALVATPAHERLFGWLPDGAGILYRSATKATNQLLAVRVEQGRVVGKPQFVGQADRMEPLGFSRDALFYGVTVDRRVVHTATVDLDAGRLVEAPERFADDASGHENWSPDGQSLAYISGRTLVVRSAAGELRQRLVLGLASPGRVFWLPDGQSVITFGTDSAGRMGIHKVDLTSGRVTPLNTRNPADRIEGDRFFTLAPDGRTVYQRRLQGEQAVIVAIDVESGTERKLLNTPIGRALTVSPDSQWLAFQSKDPSTEDFLIMMVPAAGGTPTEVFRHGDVRSAAGNHGTIAWAPDGRSLLFYLQYGTPDGGTRGGIWQAFLDGAEPRIIVDELRHEDGTVDVPQALRLSPDGRRLAFWRGRERSEYWMLKGFAPPSSFQPDGYR